MSLRRALILDCETTGLVPPTDRAIEVAVILYDLQLATPLASYSSLIRSPDNAAESINQIPVAVLTAAPEAADVWRRIGVYLEHADVVLAHRADFDRSFTPEPYASLRTWCCTKFHVSWPHGKLGDHLVQLALAHGLGVVHAHRAMSDCDTIARILTRVAETTPLVPLLVHAMRPRSKVVALTTYDERELTKSAGFAWNPKSKVWWGELAADQLAALPFATRAMQPEEDA
jgi:DNA polymerase-3 subunit epsilon